MRYRITMMGALILAIAFGNGFKEETIQTIEKNMQLSSSEASSLTMFVANINGAVEVEGYNGTEVQLKATKRIKSKWGNHQENVDDINLEMDREGNTVRVYLKSPHLRLKKNSSDRMGYKFDNRDDGDLPYEYEFDIEIRVPNRMLVDVGTINGDHVKVSNMQTTLLQVNNINGDVILDDVTGETHARTINGNVNVKFTSNPSVDSDYKTINGDIDVYFPDNLNADIHFSSLHGDVFTDFENVSYGQTDVQRERDKKGNSRYRVGREVPIRIGDGGPKHSFEVINGDVFIRRIKS